MVFDENPDHINTLHNGSTGRKYNRFHVDQWNVEGLLMKRDVTAGVHFSAILGYFNITIYADKGHNWSSAAP